MPWAVFQINDFIVYGNNKERHGMMGDTANAPRRRIVMLYEQESDALIHVLPTEAANIFFVAAVWPNRAMLRPPERQGLYQLGYIALAAHMEAVLAEMLVERLRSMTVATIPAVLAPGLSGDEVGPPRPEALLREKLLTLLEISVSELGKATYQALSEKFAALFGVSLKALLGQDLEQTVRGLFELRNTLAHGRAVRVHQAYAGHVAIEYGELKDGGNVQRLVKLLQGKGLLPTELDLLGHVPRKIFSDAVFSFFWTATRKAHAKLTTTRDTVFQVSQFVAATELPELPE